MIDPAMVRPGRLDKLLFVDLPSADERVEIMRAVTRKVPLDGKEGIEGVEKLVRDQCDGYSGADLAALVREAGVVALKRTWGSLDQMVEHRIEEPKIVVQVFDFAKALDKVSPSVSVAQRRKYEALRSKFAGLPVRNGKYEEERRVEDKVLGNGVF
jgi:ribosome biogenesis ATPase